MTDDQIARWADASEVEAGKHPEAVGAGLIQSITDCIDSVLADGAGDLEALDGPDQVGLRVEHFIWEHAMTTEDDDGNSVKTAYGAAVYACVCAGFESITNDQQGTT